MQTVTTKCAHAKKNDRIETLGISVLRAWALHRCAVMWDQTRQTSLQALRRACVPVHESIGLLVLVAASEDTEHEIWRGDVFAIAPVDGDLRVRVIGELDDGRFVDHVDRQADDAAMALGFEREVRADA